MAITFDVETNTNILASTVSKWKKTVQSHVALANPLLTKIAMNNQIAWNGGTTLRRTMDVAETDEHIQFYDWTDPL
ncbi:MAG TPA: hypothetical protein VMW52_12015, partial [Phycisphaerae bacterium]|nr:hypothetical protein [Phycisphaerae bacterium]